MFKLSWALMFFKKAILQLSNSKKHSQQAVMLYY